MSHTLDNNVSLCLGIIFNCIVNDSFRRYYALVEEYAFLDSLLIKFPAPIPASLKPSTIGQTRMIASHIATQS